MASQGKRMVPEYLIKYLEGLYNSGIDPTGFQPKLTAGDGIAIDEDNEITFDSETAAPLMENIVDSAGNKRFVDINLEPITIEGITNFYTKGLLSGTHLMLVVCGEIANGTTLTGGTDIARIINLPAYISDKIVNFYGDAYVDIKGVTLYNGTSIDSTKTIGLREVSDNNYVLRLISSVSATADLKFRMQFDLLIDSEYSE